MRDYAEIAHNLRCCGVGVPCDDCTYQDDIVKCGSLEGQAANAIEELLAAVPKWISVEERLPEKHVEVLICTEDYGKNELGFANTAAWDGSEWIETWNRKESIPYVSHWMPLPVPPKEDAK